MNVDRPLSFSEIQSWKSTLDLEVHPWEVKILKQMDATLRKTIIQLRQDND